MIKLNPSPSPSPSPSPCLFRVGVLAIQGDFAAHATAVENAGHLSRLVRSASDFDNVDALIIPGGESTAMLRGIRRDGLETPVRAMIGSGRPVLGTCAGAILLATQVTNPRQESFAALDIDIERNAYGTQLDSFDALADEDAPDSPFAAMRCVLIRAPRITRTGADVQVHARIGGVPVLVSQGSVWAATFHPELTTDGRVLAAVLGHASNSRIVIPAKAGIQVI
jgi:pyridoxal 5'-phosphate synthase pdxT subunit